MNNVLPEKALPEKLLPQTSLPEDRLADIESIEPSRWQARLNLRLQAGPRGTRLVENRHQGPLYVQKPFYPEGPELAHLYLLHPPGGLVSGDHLQISVELGSHTQALLTTPGAGRVYRARVDRAWQYQRQYFEVGEGASLEWLPLETIIYPNARTQLETHVELSAQARFIGWEVTSLGLPACDLDAQQAEVRQRLVVMQQGKPALVEQLCLDERSRRLFAAKVGMQSLPINGVFVAGPFVTMSESLSDWIAEENRQTHVNALAGISLVGDFIVGRFLGTCSEQGRKLFEHWWQCLRPHLMQRPACAPRIWLT